MLVDTHCHLNCLELAPFDHELDRAIKEAEQNEVGWFLCVAIDWEHLPEVITISEKYPNVFASVGVHPNEFAGKQPTLSELSTAAAYPGVIAIGETGLDYYRTDESLRAQQQQRFRLHIRAAIAAKKPIIVHMRDASADTLAILCEEKAEQVGGVMHCFTGDLATAELAMKLNFYISFSGIVTFNNAKALQAVARDIPLERMLIETDAPYLAPEPMRGRVNHPGYLHYTAKYLAQLKGVDYATFAKQTTDNFFSLFAKAKRK